MDLGFLNEYYIPLVLVACLIVGACVKHIKWLDKVSNEYIPTILAILGSILGCISMGGITLEYIVYGAFTGLASTGLHQAFTKITYKEKRTEE